MSAFEILSWIAGFAGHFALTVMLINLTHGVGFRESWMPRIKVGSLALMGGLFLVLLWYACTRPLESSPVLVRAYLTFGAFVSLVVVPVETVLRNLRRSPKNVTSSAELHDLTHNVSRNQLIGRGSHAWWLRIPGNEAFQIERTRQTIAFEDLPPSLQGLRILHLTDLHVHESFAPAFYDQLGQLFASEEVDLVLFTGDLIDSTRIFDLIPLALAPPQARLGKFAVLGNHDYRYDISGPTEALERCGYKVIEGCWSEVERGGVRIAIGGTSYPWGPDLSDDDRPDADFTIVLSHTPDQFYRLARRNVDLVLSGHTHGGQYRLPLLGPVLMPSRFGRRFDCGFFRSGRTLMFVGRGLAGEHPLRVNCRPEFSIIELTAALPKTIANQHESAREKSPSR